MRAALQSDGPLRGLGGIVHEHRRCGKRSRNALRRRRVIEAPMPRYRVVISDSSNQWMRRFLVTLTRGRTREVRWSGEVGSRARAVREAHNAWVEHFHEPVPVKPVVECARLLDGNVTRRGPRWFWGPDGSVPTTMLMWVVGVIVGRLGRTVQRRGPERRMAENVAIERLRFGRKRGSAFAVEILPGEEGCLPPLGATRAPPPGS